MKPWTLYLRDGRSQEVTRPLVMGILNATPDSFSDGGTLPDEAAVRVRVQEMVDGGVDILDVGGESTRPGHDKVPASDEIERVLPVLLALRTVAPDIPVSIDTQKAEVARSALEAGADFINDVAGLTGDGMRELARDTGCSAVIMRRDDIEGGLVAGCRAQLAERLQHAVASGVQRSHIILDPGLGFGSPPGSDPDANLALVDAIPEYAADQPVLIGASRKRFVGTIAGESDPRHRVEASVDVALRAVRCGAAIVRVHDVAPTVEALRRAVV